MTDDERQERKEWQAQFLKNQQEMINATVSRLLAEERAAGKDGGFSCRFCSAPATWYSYGVGACREHTPRAVDLITVQAGIDRACRVVTALATSALSNKQLGPSDDMEQIETTWADAEDEVVELRNRECELMAKTAEAKPSEAQLDIMRARELCLLRIRRVVEDWHVDNENDSLEAMRDIEQYLKETP